MRSIYQALLEMQQTGALHLLRAYEDASTWKKMAEEERLLLAKLFLQQGAKELQNNRRIPPSFRIAEQLFPHSPLIFYEEGKIFLDLSSDPECLKWAEQAFYKAIQSDPKFFEAWLERALTLVELALCNMHANGTPFDAHLLSEAAFCFQSAEPLSPPSLTEMDRGIFYWEWGNCLSAQATCSGEPSDMQLALQKYRIAEKEGCQDALFWSSLGECLIELGLLLDQKQYFLQAIEYLNKAVQQMPTLSSAWWNKGFAILKLSDFEGIPSSLLDEGDFSFFQASKLDPHNPQLWSRWGQLQTVISKIKNDFAILETSLEKFRMADQLDPGNPQILSFWAETELFIGSQKEQLNLVQSAKEKALKAVQAQPDSSDSWFLYGSCFIELGRYFDDPIHYLAAIEHFQSGTSLNQHHPLLWYGMATAYFALGDLTLDPLMIEKAVRHCARATECEGEDLSQFWHDWGVGLMKLAEIYQDPRYAESAIEKFERAITDRENLSDQSQVDLDWLYNYANAYDLLGHLKDDPSSTEKAVGMLTRLLELDPDFKAARYQLACSLTYLGGELADIELYHKANQHFRMLLESDPEDDSALLDYSLSLIGLARLVQDIHAPDKAHLLYREAEAHLMRAATLGNHQTYYHLAGLYSLNQQSEQAIQFLNKARLAGALPPLEEMLHDEWLESVRETPAFYDLLHQLSPKQKLSED